MFCDQCGKFNSPENEFCYYCGSPLIHPVGEAADRHVMAGADLTATAIGRTGYHAEKKVTEKLPEEEVHTSETTDSLLQNMQEGMSEETDSLPQDMQEGMSEEADSLSQNMQKEMSEEMDTLNQSTQEETSENEDSLLQNMQEEVSEKTSTLIPDKQENKQNPGGEVKEKSVKKTGAEIVTKNIKAESEAETGTNTVSLQTDVPQYSEQMQNGEGGGSSSRQIEQESPGVLQLRSRRERNIFLLVELVIMAAAAVTLGILVHRNYGPEQDARTYLCSRLIGDWEKSYRYLDFGENVSDLISEDMYKKVMKRSASKGFSDLSLTEVTDPAVLSVEAGIQETLTSDEKVYKAVYYDLTDEEQKTEYLLMEKTDERYGLIFHRWKVNVSELCISNLTVTVHTGAALTLNGCTISSDPEENPDNATDTYTLDQLFKGNYTADLTMENGESGREELQIDASDTAIDLSETELYPDQALMNQVLDQFVTDYQAILNASLNGVEFAEVQNYFAENAIADGRAQAMYENACSQAFTEEKGVGIMKIELSDITAEYVSWKKSNYASAGDLVMEISTTMSYTYTEDGGQTQKSDVQSSVGLLCYHQENGQWKIQSFS